MKIFLLAAAVFAFFFGAPANTTPQTLIVHTVSWNSGNLSAPKDLEMLIGLDGGQTPDIIAVAVQGFGFKSDKSHQGPACVKNFQEATKPKDYVKLKSTVTETMALIVYCLEKHRDENTLDHKTGIMSMNHSTRSGGITTGFTLYDKRFVFATSRMSDDEATGSNPKYAYDTSMDLSRLDNPPDFLFWIGDLNVRVKDKSPQEAKNLINQNKLDDLFTADQLKNAKEKGCFKDWNEPEIKFKPTFKFKPNTDAYDLSATPSWTDRALYKSGTGKKIEVLIYTSLDHYKQTEHRPVKGQFKVHLN